MMFILKPIYKHVIWGGAGILRLKGEEGSVALVAGAGIGESWEVSDMEGEESEVCGGPHAGETLRGLLERYGEGLTGAGVLRGGRFPLLLKLIDARENLSIQVHPDDELAWRRHGESGKTEMWYVVGAERGASLYCGFSRAVERGEYEVLLREKRLVEVLQRYEVSPGDVFYIPAGCIHAIGAGCLIAEIQQSSKLTYRIYDYDRRGLDGQLRPLHRELAGEAIDFSYQGSYRVEYGEGVEGVGGRRQLVSCRYFTTNLVCGEKELSVSTGGRFQIYICVEGRALFVDVRGEEVEVSQGQTLFVGGDTGQFDIKPAGRVKLLETYIM
ncbi:MAG: class I mannose-6-phosphate isomerase [Tannerellaceae bacterium]|jgi:mannose-6-phosphate isomerase|nr:class I mannose-6-phosphate isomerase [Tannerellaceae bacterium]